MGATDSLTEFFTAIRAWLLAYTDGGAAPNTINAATTGRVYNETPAAGAAYPYVILSIDGNPADRDKDPARIEFQVEVQVIHRPRTNIVSARRIADLAWKAMAAYQVGNATDGFVKLRVPSLPETLPAGGSDADAEVVQIRIVSDGFSYWKGLASAVA